MKAILVTSTDAPQLNGDCSSVGPTRQECGLISTQSIQTVVDSLRSKNRTVYQI